MSTRAVLNRRRRQQTLEAAVEVIAERGLCETRVADVADRAGVSAALILYYFETKENLLTEALAHAEDRFYLSSFHELAAIRSPRDRLARLIELSCPPDEPTTETMGDWVLWLELWVRALRDPNAARKREALDRRWRATIADVVRAGQETGEFPADSDAGDLALRLSAFMDGLAVQILMRDSEVTNAKMRRLCMEMAASSLDFPIPEETTASTGS